MAQYLEKDAVLAEIKRHISIAESQLALFGNEDEKNRIMWAQQKKVCEIILSFLDSHEVKEVDLNFQRFAKEMDAIFVLPSSETKNTEEEPLNWEYAIAKHFFELGLNSSNKLTWEDMRAIYCIILNLREHLGVSVFGEPLYKEALNRFKAQKVK